MQHIAQWGDYQMIHWSPNVNTFVWSCVWGCYGYDFDTEHQAREAFDSHVCVATSVSPCS